MESTACNSTTRLYALYQYIIRGGSLLFFGAFELLGIFSVLTGIVSITFLEGLTYDMFRHVCVGLLMMLVSGAFLQIEFTLLQKLNADEASRYKRS